MMAIINTFLMLSDLTHKRNACEFIVPLERTAASKKLVMETRIRSKTKICDVTFHCIF